MLDTFIIDRIRRDQERNRRDSRIPLHIEDRRPSHDDPDRERREPKKDERGSAIIDFKL